MTQSTWHVCVRFIEPTFDQHLHRESETRFWTWEGSASTSASASSQAIAEFKRLWALSSVGWVREIQGVSVSLQGQAQ